MVQSPDLFPSYQISDFIQRQGPQEYKHARDPNIASPVWTEPKFQTPVFVII